jgi:4-hydroxy-tetrahydrodipicolinate synthase
LSCTGTTGEPTSLTLEEKELVIRTGVEACAGRVPVLAGTGSSSTAETIELSRYARVAGADGILVVAPCQVSPHSRVSTSTSPPSLERSMKCP